MLPATPVRFITNRDNPALSEGPSRGFLPESALAPRQCHPECVVHAALGRSHQRNRSGMPTRKINRPVNAIYRLGHGIWTLLKNVAFALGCLMVGVPMLIVGLFYSVTALQDVTYARSTFGPFYGIARVIASKRWHRSNEIFGCTYAIVELTPARSAELIAGDKFREVFGNHRAYWRHPPNLQPTPGNLDLQSGCYLEGMSSSDRQAVLGGLNEPGGWAGVFDAENVAFFLPKRKLIGIIRNGD